MNSSDKKERQQIVREIMKDIHRTYGKYPVNLTDLVFLEIEKDYMAEYNRWVLSGTSQSINMAIGRFVLDESGLKNLGKEDNPKSKLIKSYSRLGHK